MRNFFRYLWVVASIELRQRVRGVAWWVLLGVFFLLVLLVSVLLSIGLSYTEDAGAGLYSTVIYFVLLLGSLVVPALSGNAINGDRDTGTLATTQVTLITTTQLVLGKFVAAWITALAFLAAALPFLIYSFALGGAHLDTAVVSVLVLALELGIISGIGVGLSGILRRGLFSIVVTYLAVALLSVGTLIAFGLGGLLSQETVTISYSSMDPDSGTVDPATGETTEITCDAPHPEQQQVFHFERVWWMLAANPYVILADAVPTHYGDERPVDLFGTIKFGERSAQVPQNVDRTVSECADDETVYPTPKQVIDETVPGWAVGLLVNLALAVAALWGAIALTHAPSRRLAPGSRVA